jgi:hypothetical protein
MLLRPAFAGEADYLKNTFAAVEDAEHHRQSLIKKKLSTRGYQNPRPERLSEKHLFGAEMCEPGSRLRGGCRLTPGPGGATLQET